MEPGPGWFSHWASPSDTVTYKYDRIYVYANINVSVI